MNSEAAVISAVCKNKDIATVLSENIDDVFVTYRDVWDGLKGYYYKFKSVPDISVLKEKFPGFESEPVKGETGYYVNYPISGFTIEHEFTKYQADDSTVYGQFANGPLQTPYFELDTLYSDAEHFRLVGSQISGLNETPGQCYTRYKVTSNLSGNFTYVDFYWFANNNL